MGNEGKGNKIHNLVEYINHINEIANDATSTHYLFFRGQSKKNLRLLPKVCRDESTFRFENELINETIRKMPQLFNENMSAVDILTILQHFGIPTRLLDFTTNALVALLFCV